MKYDPNWPARLRAFVDRWRAENPTMPVTLSIRRQAWTSYDLVRIGPGMDMPPDDIVEANCFAIDQDVGNLSELLRKQEFDALPMQAQIDALWAMVRRAAP